MSEGRGGEGRGGEGRGGEGRGGDGMGWEGRGWDGMGGEGRGGEGEAENKKEEWIIYSVSVAMREGSERDGGSERTIILVVSS